MGESTLASALWLLLLTMVARRDVDGVLVTTPMGSQEAQPCGCNNDYLYSLVPDPNIASGETPIALDLTAFFNFNTSDISSDCLQGGNGEPSTSHLIPAALIALDEINNSSSILQGYHLQLDVKDSQCDPIRALAEYSYRISEELGGDNTSATLPYNLGIVGPGCGVVTESLASVNERSLKLPIVSYGLPPVMKEQLMTLFDTSRSILRSMGSAIGVLRHFNWTHNIAFLTEDADVFVRTVENVIFTDVNGTSSLQDSVGRIALSEFSKINVRTLTANMVSVEKFLNSVREKNVRVIIALVSQKNAAELICMVKSTGYVPGNGYVYIFVGSFASNWWQIERDICNLTKLDVQSTLVISGDIIQPNVDVLLYSGQTVHDFKVEYSRRLREWCSFDIFSRRATDTAAGSVYDAIWAFALALNQTTSLIDEMAESSTRYDSGVLSNIVQSLKRVNFQGVTGPFYFEDGQRGRPDTILQIQGGDTNVVAQYNGSFDLVPDVMFIWNGSDNMTVPSDEPRIVMETVPIYWLVITMVFTISGFIFCFFMCFFNWYYGHHKILLASSQRLNYVILVGVIFGYFTVVILTVLNSPLAVYMSNDVFKALCLIRIWLLPLSFTFTYGIMFARGWRLYRVFHNPWSKSRLYKDSYLFLIVLIAAAIDVLILLPWTVIDPYRRMISDDAVNYDQYTQCQHSHCSSSNIYWLGILSTYKIVLILVGVAIIGFVRENVKRRKIFDDSRSLANCLYLTSGAFVLGLPLTLLFQAAGFPILSYLVSVLWVNVSSSGTLICIFLPKFYKIVVKKDSGRDYKSAKSLYMMKYTSSATDMTRSYVSRTSLTHISRSDIDAIRGTSNSPSNWGSDQEKRSPPRHVHYEMDSSESLELNTTL